MEALALVLKAIGSKSDSQLDSAARYLGSDRLVDALRARISLIDLQTAAEDTPLEWDIWRIESIYERLMAHAHSARSMVRNIYATTREIKDLELRVAGHRFERDLAGGPMKMALEEQRNAWQISATNYTNAASQADTAAGAISSAMTFRDTNLGNLVQNSRSLASISNNNPDNPARYAATEAIVRHNHQDSQYQLGAASSAQKSAASSLNAATGFAERSQAAADKALEGLQTTQTFHNMAVTVLQDLQTQSLLEDDLAQQLVHLQAVSNQLGLLVATFATALENLYAAKLPKLCASWRDAAELDYQTGAAIEQCLALLTISDSVLRRIEMQLSLRAAVSTVTLRRVDDANLEGTLSMPTAGFEEARLRGFSFHVPIDPDSCLTLQIECEGVGHTRTIFVARAGDSAADGSSQIHGAPEVWNRPMVARATFKGQLFGAISATLPETVELTAFIHYLA